MDKPRGRSPLSVPAPRLVRAAGLAALCWQLEAPLVAVSSAVVGGGIGECRWVLNVQVPLGYDRIDPAAHLAEVAAAAGCRGPGVGLLTAADVSARTVGDDEGCTVVATVGLGMVTWAADQEGAWQAWRAGTINLVGVVAAPLSPAALVNAVMTMTEAKTQALLEAGVPGTGTASDAVCLLTPPPPPGEPGEPYGGPRSPWGSRLARATHRAVAAGIAAGIPEGLSASR